MNAYLDNSATTKPSAAVAAAVRELMEGGWYNPSALYKPALEIQKKLDAVRETCLEAAGAQGVIEQFADPPQEARPRVWWHWMDGNVSIDGITKDIDWMERAGIGGFHQFDAGGLGMRPIVDERLPSATR